MRGARVQCVSQREGFIMRARRCTGSGVRTRANSTRAADSKTARGRCPTRSVEEFQLFDQTMRELLSIMPAMGNERVHRGRSARSGETQSRPRR